MTSEVLESPNCILSRISVFNDGDDNNQNNSTITTKYYYFCCC